MRLGLAVFLFSLPALAQAQSSTAIRVGALRSEARTPLVLEREEVVLECTAPEEGADTLPCTLRIRYTLSNPDPEGHAVSLRFSVENLDGLVVGDEGGAPSQAPVTSARRFPFDPGASRTLLLSGSAELVRVATGPIAGTDGLAARHPILATSYSTEERGFIYSRAVMRHFASAPDDFFVRAHLPAGYSLDAGGDGATRVPEESVDGWMVIRVRRPEDAEQDYRVIVRRGSEAPIVRNGGVFLALGGIVLGPGPLPNVFWGRLGYEIGFFDWLIVSAAVETNFSSNVGLGIMLEAASPTFGLPPSFSLGVGTAIRLLPRPAGGLRLAVGTTVYSIGFEALFDYYPDDAGFTITLLGRAGL